MLAFTELGLDLWIKRDDLTSNDLSGNKVRKLEFLLARAIEGSHDSVITIGIGEDSKQLIHPFLKITYFYFMFRW